MPILLILLVTAACLPVPWPAPPLGIGPEGAAALTGGQCNHTMQKPFVILWQKFSARGLHPISRRKASPLFSNIYGQRNYGNASIMNILCWWQRIKVASWG